MFNDFDDAFEIHKVIFEAYLEDRLINRQTMQAPKEMIMANFIQLVQQAGNDKRPMKIKMIRPEVIWDNFENKQKVLSNEVEFSNNAMIDFQENK